MLVIALLANALISGLFYAMMAIGLCLIYGILRIVNFAHGEFYTIGTYLYTFVAISLGVSVWVALITAVIFSMALGWLTERLLMRPLYAGYTSWTHLNLRHEYAVIVTLGLSLLLMNLVEKAFGPFNFFGPPLIDIPRVTIGPVILSGHRILAAVLCALVIGIVVAFVRYSHWGKQIQAVSQNRFGATLVGINASTSSAIVFAIAGGLTALTGALLAPIVLTDPVIGTYPAVKAFIVIVIGGMGSIGGAIIGGMALSILETFAAVFIAPEFKDAYGLAMLMLVLILRPQGLFGQKGREV